MILPGIPCRPVAERKIRRRGHTRRNRAWSVGSPASKTARRISCPDSFPSAAGFELVGRAAVDLLERIAETAGVAETVALGDLVEPIVFRHKLLLFGASRTRGQIPLGGAMRLGTASRLRWIIPRSLVPTPRKNKKPASKRSALRRAITRGTTQLANENSPLILGIHQFLSINAASRSHLLTLFSAADVVRQGFRRSARKG